jgi:hypothetical protein
VRVRILKYPIPQPDNEGVVTIRLPIGARVLSFGQDGDGTLCLWAEVSTDNAKAFEQSGHSDPHLYRFVNTGVEFTRQGEYVQTVPFYAFAQATIIWHIYELPRSTT